MYPEAADMATCTPPRGDLSGQRVPWAPCYHSWASGTYGRIRSQDSPGTNGKTEGKREGKRKSK